MEYYTGPRYNKEDYDRNKTILFHRNLDGSTVRMEIPGGTDLNEMLEHFKYFMQALTYHIDGDFEYIRREDREAEERDRREFRERMDRESEPKQIIEVNDRNFSCMCGRCPDITESCK